MVEGTQKQNIAHAIEARRGFVGTKNGSSKLTDAVVLEIRRRYEAGETQQKIADDVGCSQVNVSLIVRWKKWVHVGCRPGTDPG